MSDEANIERARRIAELVAQYDDIVDRLSEMLMPVSDSRSVPAEPREKRKYTRRSEPAEQPKKRGRKPKRSVDVGDVTWKCVDCSKTITRIDRPDLCIDCEGTTFVQL